MGMTNSIAKEYINVVDRIRTGNYRNRQTLAWLERERTTLHQQLRELCGGAVSMAKARKLSARSR